MNIDWIYDLPALSLAAVVVGSLTCFGLVGMRVTRPLVVRWLGDPHPHNDVVSLLLATLGVLYGITLGLVSIAAWEAYEGTASGVDQEVAVAAALIADVDLLPEPARTEVLQSIALWRDHVVNESWPAQREGLKPESESAMLHRVERALVNFVPRTATEGALLAAALSEVNGLVRLGMQRFEAVESGLPRILWRIVILGAIQLIVCLWLQSSAKISLVYFSTAMVAGLLGLLIFFLAEVNNPLRGDYGISSDGFRDLRINLTAP